MANVNGPIVMNDVTLTAGAADTTSDTLIVSPYGAEVAVWLTNGATGPTVAAQVQIQKSVDGSKWADVGGALVGGTANSGVYSWMVELPGGFPNVRFVCGSNTAQNVTVAVHAGPIA